MPLKDTKEGETHSFNDGCGVGEHNNFTCKQCDTVIVYVLDRQLVGCKHHPVQGKTYAEENVIVCSRGIVKTKRCQIRLPNGKTI